MLLSNNQLNKTERYGVVETFVTQLITKGKMTDLTPLYHATFYFTSWLERIF
jgi:hypothetical protein